LLIIFDLDDTLIDTSGCITPIRLEDALTQMVKAGLNLPDFTQGLEQLRRIDAGAESAKDALAEFLEIHDADKKYLDIALKEIYENFSHDLPIFTFDGVVDTLKSLAGLHRLALVTAGFEDYQHWKLKKTGIDSSFFSKIVVCESGSKKAHYKLIVEELGISQNDVVVCGDRIAKDLSPAKDLGFRTIHMRKGRGKRYSALSDDVDYSVDEFYKIPEVITSIILMNSFLK
jgi:putative hydrolase of the HAD superfamily